MGEVISKPITWAYITWVPVYLVQHFNVGARGFLGLQPHVILTFDFFIVSMYFFLCSPMEVEGTNITIQVFHFGP